MEVAVRTELKKIGLQKTLDFLKAMNCCYKIIDEDNNLYTNIPADEVPKPPKRAQSKYPWGTLSAHVKKYLGNVKPGEFAVLPPGKFDHKYIYRTASSYMSQKWGEGSYTSHSTDEGLEILRIR